MEDLRTTEFIEPVDKVYVRTDSQNHITAIDSEWNIKDLTDWTYIDEGYGDRFKHSQGNYFEKPVMNFDGTHNYKLVDGSVVETTAEEKAEELASFPQPEPDPITQLQADIVEAVINEYKVTIGE